MKATIDLWRAMLDGIVAKFRRSIMEYLQSFCRSSFSIELEMLDRSSQQHSSWMLIRCISVVDIFLLRYHSFDTSSFVSSRSKVDIWTMIWELNRVVRYSSGFALAPEGDANSVIFLEFERDLSSAKQFQWYRLVWIGGNRMCRLLCHLYLTWKESSSWVVTVWLDRFSSSESKE